MKLTVFFLLVGVLAAACASSGKNDHTQSSYPHLVTLSPPVQHQKNQRPSKIYIDSVKAIRYHQRQAILIKGSFPDGCTKLKTATLDVTGDSLSLALEAWRDPGKMCTQALTPFSYIYDDPGELNHLKLRKFRSVKVNGKTFEIR